jgi:hypothetical protein
MVSRFRGNGVWIVRSIPRLKPEEDKDNMRFYGHTLISDVTYKRRVLFIQYNQDILEGGYMLAEVKVIEGGQLIKTEKMKLKKVKEFSNNIIIYENEEERAVVYFANKDEFVLISIDMA